MWVLEGVDDHALVFVPHVHHAAGVTGTDIANDLGAECCGPGEEDVDNGVVLGSKAGRVELLLQSDGPVGLINVAEAADGGGEGRRGAGSHGGGESHDAKGTRSVKVEEVWRSSV